MLKATRILFGITLSLALVGPALAQGNVKPQWMEPTWQASYWNNMTLSGPPVFWRSEANLDYDWASGSPDYRIAADHFSARWSRNIDLPAGIYRFSATSDDGIRVYVDSELIINAWYDHAPETYTADKYISSGDHMVLVEYYENMGGAVCRVSWSLVSQPAGDWTAEYFNNTTLSGTPALTRYDAAINFNWGEGSPAPSIISSDNFSVRWSRYVDLPAGQYRFSATVDDGVRVWGNGHLVIDAWYDSPPHTLTGDIWLPGGPIPLRMEYYERTGIAVAQLSWYRVDVPSPPPAPYEIIVDDTSLGFVKGGSPTGWHVAYTGYGGSITWTRNNDWKRPNYNWARWYPTLPAGRYEVFVYIPDWYTTTTRAHYWVAHSTGFTLRIVDQSANGGRWVSLGTYNFTGTGSDYVSLNDTTYEPYLSRLIGFDAVKWVPR